MRSYEMMLIVTEEVGADEKKVRAVAEKLLGNYAKGIKDIMVYGKKTLSFPINKKTEGIYALIHISAERLIVDNLQKQQKLMTEVIRFLVQETEA